MKRFLVFLYLLLFALCVVASAGAVPILVTDRGTLAGTDFVDWGLAGPENTTLSNPFDILSNGGISVNVSKPLGSTFVRLDQGSGWSGNFSPGDHLLWASERNNVDNPIALTNFDGEGILAGGAQIQACFFGAFTAKIEIFDDNGNSLGSFTLDGNSTSDADNSAIFIGITNDVAFHEIAFSLTQAHDEISSFSINQFDFTPFTSNAVPEPATMLLLGSGLVGLAGFRRKFKKA